MADAVNGGTDENESEFDKTTGGVTYLCGGKACFQRRMLHVRKISRDVHLSTALSDRAPRFPPRLARLLLSSSTFMWRRFFTYFAESHPYRLWCNIYWEISLRLICLIRNSPVSPGSDRCSTLSPTTACNVARVHWQRYPRLEKLLGVNFSPQSMIRAVCRVVFLYLVLGGDYS